MPDNSHPLLNCHCSVLTDLAVIPMGGDGLDERVFATVDRVCDHGGAQWWLYLSRCSRCGQYWMIAQEERIYDEYFLKRLPDEEVDAIHAEQRWPEDFLAYEQVLQIGRAHGPPFTFLDRHSPTLINTIADLRRERPTITTDRIADLLGISAKRVSRLARPPSRVRTWKSLLGLAK
jgi:hypothetical protein